MKVGFRDERPGGLRELSSLGRGLRVPESPSPVPGSSLLWALSGTMVRPSWPSVVIGVAKTLQNPDFFPACGARCF